MNKSKIINLFLMAIAAFFSVGCAGDINKNSDDFQVITANDHLIRLTYNLADGSLTAIENYAVTYCNQAKKQAVKGTQSCDGERCEVTFFCEG